MTAPAWITPETRALFDMALEEYAKMVLAHTTEAEHKYEVAAADFFDAVRRDAVVSSMESDEATANMGRIG